MPSGLKAWHYKGLNHLEPTHLLFSIHIFGSKPTFLSYSPQPSSAKLLLWPSISNKSILHTTQRPTTAEATADAVESALSMDVSILEGRPPARARREGPKLGTRCKMGCYVCGETVSSQFHRWRNSKLALFIEKIKAQRPASEEICDKCLRKIRRNPCQAMPREVRSSLDMRSIANGEGLLLCV